MIPRLREVYRLAHLVKGLCFEQIIARDGDWDKEKSKRELLSFSKTWRGLLLRENFGCKCV